MKTDKKDIDIIKNVDNYYSQKMAIYGSCPKGVDWNGEISQIIRFKQLLRVISNLNTYFTLNDLGCGYGSLLEYLSSLSPEFQYTGIDISSVMIEAAKHKFSNFYNPKIGYTFEVGNVLTFAEYTVASGIFNVKQETNEQIWMEYTLDIIRDMNKFSTKGFSFNILTKYSDIDYMKPYLFYADPCFFFDFCKKNFSKNVALLHDYNLYEFTIGVIK